MEFCPKCGSILIMKKKRFGCLRCNYIAKQKVNMEVKEEIKGYPSVAVVNDMDKEIYPMTDYTCEKCGNKKAYFWLRQMRAGDESESKFFKCTKCKNIVRED